MKFDFDASQVEPLYDLDSYFKSFGKIDYQAVNQALLGNALDYLQQWLPGGKKVGKEYVCADLFGGKGGSTSINLSTGQWSDFATTHKGGDLVSLYAAIFGLKMHEAAVEILGSNVPTIPSFVSIGRLRRPIPDAVVLQRNWIPVPPWAEKHSCIHSRFGEPSRIWRYCNEKAQTIGLVARYDPPEMRKQFIPWTHTGVDWKPGAWSGLYPLYGLDLISANPEKALLFVEGEKAADAARQFVGDDYIVTTWPGGSPAVEKTDISFAIGRNVLLWPDADAPGVEAMDKLQGMLDGKAKSVEVLSVKDFPEKFDAADALADGWNKDRFDKFVSSQFSAKQQPSSCEIVVEPAAERKVANISAYKPNKIPPHLLKVPGILGRVVDWGLSNSRKPQPVYAVQSALALGSVVLGRKYVTSSGNWPSLYFVVIGKTATGKEIVKWIPETVLDAAGFHELIGYSRYSSEAGLVSSLFDKPCHITVMDEFGKVLDSANSPKNVMARDLLKQMIEIWGRCHGRVNPVGYANAGLTKNQSDALKERIIYNPALTFIGMTTHETFFDALTNGAVEDGFLNRLLVVECHADRTTSAFAAATEVPENVVAWVQEMRKAIPDGLHEALDQSSVANMKANPVVVQINSEAMAEFALFDSQCVDLMNENDSIGMAELWGRANEMSMRLALIVAKSCESSEVEAEHARWSIDYIRFWTQEMVRQAIVSISNGDTDAAIKQVEKVLASAHPIDNGCTERELRKLSRRFAKLNPQVQMHVLERLQRDGVVEFHELVGMNGKKRKAWIYVGE